MANWYDLGWKTENGNQQTSSSDDIYQVGSASGVANQNNVITNLATFGNGTKIKLKIHYTDNPNITPSIYQNIGYKKRNYYVDVLVDGADGNEYICSSDYALGTCSYESLGALLKPFDFQDWGDYNANTTRLNNAYNESQGVVNTIYPYMNIGGHSTSAPYFMRVNSDNDIEFIAYGDECYDTGGNLIRPTIVIGKISRTLLNNPQIFDPTTGLKEEDIIKTGGGAGGRKPSKNYNGDDIDFPTLPTGASALGFGKLNIFKPTSPQLSSALDILWSDANESTLETIIESAKKWWYKPEQYCTAIMLTPVNVTTSGSKVIYFGKYDSGVSASTVSDQWQITDRKI